ncbi:SGNH/GDSL hydrolase family protein [Hymenobacter chitinivorans]|uniref:GDSL-like lipase/acylhydrolase family protein n=1 Tax=Hymenobacter chitinivorans DSM 11115 TaxID=1121954 RepID=A0A2M9B5G7_9BACT|nr:SGNH/GDSL hydrolase family protein [Hymenobacter chitinivorans]PJJ53177.1 GDSL-like lipase/acylhydrolase family protein [Hymenobacter chitinivorans DSM 11115]
MNTTLFRKLVPVALLGLGFTTACQPDIEDQYPVSKGSADFTRYISVGNSLTAGYSDGGLYLEGQLSSYPNLLAGQFKQAGGGDFNQPLFTEAQSNGSGYLRLVGIVNGSPVTASVTSNLAVRSASPLLYTRYDGPVNNLGVPGIRLADIQTPGYGSTQGNPYFERITPTASATQTYFQRVKAEAATATFFTNWLGNNDVLGYATTGGASTAAASTITNTDTFRLKYNRIVNVLTANGAKGVLATIPDVTTIPFFTTVGPSFKATLQSKQVPGLIVMSGSAAGGAPGYTNRKPITTADIKDAAGTGRQLFTLTAAPFLPLVGTPTGRPWRYIYGQSGQPAIGFPLFLAAYGIDTTKVFGVTNENPIPSAFILDDSEQNAIRTALTSFNTTIRNKAAEKGLALFDANTFFTVVSGGGIVTNNINNTSAYITGNLFSLDGVHPTPRGYAIVANEMIKAINATYGASVPFVNAGNYRGVRFPQ